MFDGMWLVERSAEGHRLEASTLEAFEETGDGERLRNSLLRAMEKAADEL